MSETVSRLAPALAERYRVERELGSGGMATVYLAHDHTAAGRGGGARGFAEACRGPAGKRGGVPPGT